MRNLWVSKEEEGVMLLRSLGRSVSLPRCAGLSGEASRATKARIRLGKRMGT